jgi:DNA-binding NtrC family response regulator
MSSGVELSSLWFLNTVSDDPQTISPEIRAAFSSQGWTLQPWTGKPESIPGLLMVAAATPAVIECIQFASNSGHLPVFVCTRQSLGAGTVRSVLQAGAEDVYDETMGSDVLVQAILSRCQRRMRAIQQLEEQQAAGFCIGISPRWKRLLRDIVQSAWKPNLPILLTGDSGTGKEGTARLIHRVCAERAARQFVIVDCTTLRTELSGSELFGHVKGAFTGAAYDRDGAFTHADQGTLFLDEIGELPLSLQAELLRILQEQTYKPVGGNFWKRTNFRLVSATNRNLEAEVAAGRFRADLYFRIAGGAHFHLPPLAERREDIGVLAHHFLTEGFDDQQLPAIAQDVTEYLAGRPYPGNVRELRSLVHRMLARYSGAGPLTLGTLAESDLDALVSCTKSWHGATLYPAIEQAVTAGVPLKEIGKQAEEIAISIAIHREQGNLQRAAAQLQVTDRSLQMRIAARREGQSAYAQ